MSIENQLLSIEEWLEIITTKWLTLDDERQRVFSGKINIHEWLKNRYSLNYDAPTVEQAIDKFLISENITDL